MSLCKSGGFSPGELEDVTTHLLMFFHLSAAEVFGWERRIQRELVSGRRGGACEYCQVNGPRHQPGCDSGVAEGVQQRGGDEGPHGSVEGQALAALDDELAQAGA